VVIAVGTLVLAVPVGVRRSRVCRAFPERNLGEEDPVFLRYHRRSAFDRARLRWLRHPCAGARLAFLHRSGLRYARHHQKLRASGKAAKQILTACIRKLLVVVLNAIMRDRKPRLLPA
jgi:hypothetical protein